jgi:competence ComEA-like helix-hairpin-helix protein
MATSSTGIPACATSHHAQLVDMQGNLKSGSCALLLVSRAVIVLFVSLGIALAPKTPLPQPINLNTATIAQLETLPGVGPNTAKSIVDFRNHSGPFQRVEDLLAIKGISKSKAAPVCHNHAGSHRT